MRVFLTGGTGFIGSYVASILRKRGDEVLALVRSEARATHLTGMGCDLAQGDVTNGFEVERSLKNVDAVIHTAGRYEIGIKKEDCPKMQDVNIGGVRNVLNAALEAGVPRIVHTSSVTAFGDTGGRKLDETFVRNESLGFLSCYDESKYRSHMLAQGRIEKGAPVVIVQPGAVYGPNDHSEIGRQILQAANGTLKAVIMPELGLTMAHVEDVAQGIVDALDRGTIGESYCLGGESVRAGDLLQKAAEFGGRRLPKRRVTASTLRSIAPFMGWIGPKLGYPANLREVVSAADGVTYWCDDTKARNELGYKSRSLDEGLRETLKADGVFLKG